MNARKQTPAKLPFKNARQLQEIVARLAQAIATLSMVSTHVLFEDEQQAGEAVGGAIGLIGQAAALAETLASTLSGSTVSEGSLA